MDEEVALTSPLQEANATPEILAYKILPDGSVDDCEVEEALENHRSTGKSYWIDTILHNEIDAKAIHSLVLERLDLPSYLRRHLVSMRQLQTSQVLLLAKAVLVVVRILPAGHSESPLLHYAAALCLPGLFLTVATIPSSTTTSTSEASQDLASTSIGKHKCRRKLQRQDRHFLLQHQDTIRIIRQQPLVDASTTGACIAWLSSHTRHMAHVTSQVRERIFTLVEKIDEEEIGSVSLSEIVELKDAVLRLSAVAEEQDECLQSLVQDDSITIALKFENHVKGFWSILRSTVGATDRMATRLEKRMIDLRQAYDAHQQDRMNRRLGWITVLSAIFLPLTLMAGIWGMNFTNMPELQSQNGYYFAISSMIVVAFALLLGFYRFGWLQ